MLPVLLLLLLLLLGEQLQKHQQRWFSGLIKTILVGPCHCRHCCCRRHHCCRYRRRRRCRRRGNNFVLSQKPNYLQQQLNDVCFVSKSLQGETIGQFTFYSFAAKC